MQTHEKGVPFYKLTHKTHKTSKDSLDLESFLNIFFAKLIRVSVLPMVLHTSVYPVLVTHLIMTIKIWKHGYCSLASLTCLRKQWLHKEPSCISMLSE